LEVISFWGDNEIDSVKKFVEENGLTWSSHIIDGWNAEGGIRNKLKIPSVPSAYIIDKNGVLIVKRARSDEEAVKALEYIFKKQ
jgi:hypothetical protein